MHENNNVTSFSTITLLLLKETRLELGIYQAQVAERCGKNPSAWAKIETGKSPLTIEAFFRACQALTVQPSVVMAATERYASLLSQYGWIVLMELDSSEDILSQKAQEYYSTSGFRSRMPLYNWTQSIRALNSPIFNYDGNSIFIDVFRFAIDPNFREQQINFIIPTIPIR